MAEAMVEGVEREDNDAGRRVRPPDRKRHEEELEVLNAEIKAKEIVMKGLVPRGEDGGLQGQLRELRGEKESLIQRCRDLDAELKEVNTEIGKRKESLARIETGLQYKNEDKINEAIRKLEHQLKTTNYGLREEKKIVAEIDRLKRSKKSLVQYNGEKKVIDTMRDSQRKMREQRDHFYKTVKSLKAKEEHLKRNVRDSRDKSEVVKKELDELYLKKRGLQSEFKKQEREFNEHKNGMRRRKYEEIRMRKEEERRVQQEQYQKELAEYEASREPYEDEKQLCRTLSAYLQRYLVDEGGDKNLSLLTPQEGDIGTDQVDVAEPEGMTVLKKKDVLDLYLGVKPKVMKKKKEKKKAVNKVVHNPEVLSQFLQIGLQAPSSVNDVPALIQQLKEKLEYYQSLPPPPKSKNSGEKYIGTEGSSDGSGGAPSVGESAICESVPSTPEVQNDNIPPQFDPQGQMDELWPQPRRVSRDSGTELEESEELNEVSHMTSDDLHRDRGHKTDLDRNSVDAAIVKDLRAFNFSQDQNISLNVSSSSQEHLQVDATEHAPIPSFVDSPPEGDGCSAERPLESNGAGLLNHAIDNLPSSPLTDRLTDSLQEVVQPVS